MFNTSTLINFIHIIAMLLFVSTHIILKLFNKKIKIKVKMYNITSHKSYLIFLLL